MARKIKETKFSIRYNGFQPGYGGIARENVDGRHAILASHGAYEEKFGSSSQFGPKYEDTQAGYLMPKAKHRTRVPKRAGKLFFWAVEGRYGVGHRNTLVRMLSAPNPTLAQIADMKRLPEQALPNSKVIDYVLYWEHTARIVSKDIAWEIHDANIPDAGDSQVHDLITIRKGAEYVHLSDLWPVLETHGLQYTAIHCLFCRVPLQAKNRPKVRIG